MTFWRRKGKNGGQQMAPAPTPVAMAAERERHAREIRQVREQDRRNWGRLADIRSRAEVILRELPGSQ